MNAEYPDGYWEKKYNEKTKWQKIKHAYRFSYRCDGLKGVMGYTKAAITIYCMIYTKRVRIKLLEILYKITKKV